jgi:hypothetical protein
MQPASPRALRSVWRYPLPAAVSCCRKREAGEECQAEREETKHVSSSEGRGIEDMDKITLRAAEVNSYKGGERGVP